MLVTSLHHLLAGSIDIRYDYIRSWAQLQQPVSATRTGIQRAQKYPDLWRSGWIHRSTLHRDSGIWRLQTALVGKIKENVSRDGKDGQKAPCKHGHILRKTGIGISAQSKTV